MGVNVSFRDAERDEDSLAVLFIYLVTRFVLRASRGRRSDGFLLTAGISEDGLNDGSGGGFFSRPSAAFCSDL